MLHFDDGPGSRGKMNDPCQSVSREDDGCAAQPLHKDADEKDGHAVVRHRLSRGGNEDHLDGDEELEAHDE